MISPIKFAKIPYLSIKKGFMNNIRLISALLLFVFIMVWQGIVLFPALILYFLWSVINWIVKPDRMELAQRLLPSHKRINKR